MPLLLNRATTERLLDRVNHTLGNGFYIASAWSEFDGSATDTPGNARILAAATERIAQAGWQLYQELSGDTILQQVLTYINNVTEQNTIITIRTKDVYLPWELLYPFRFDTEFDDEDRARWPLKTEAIWGGRFAIETIQTGEGPYGQQQMARRKAPPSASINVNPTITLDGTTKPHQPRLVHNNLVHSLKRKGCLVQLNDKCQSIRSVLLKARDHSTLIYVFCHGSLSSDREGEELLLDTNCSVQPRAIDDERTFPNGPVIFLNACHSGAFSPLSFTNFLRIFRRKHSLGLISTNFTVPTCFAATFGAEVVTAYFTIKEKNLSRILLDLRRSHLLRGNPIPLFYTVQCQVEL